MRETSPVGVPVVVEFTVTCAVTGVPWVMLTGDVELLIFRLVVVPLKVPSAVPQAAARLATLTVPKPVA